MRSLFAAFALLVLLLASSLYGLDVPLYTSLATDLADLLSSSELRALNQKLLDYRAQSGHEIAVLIIPTLGDEALEDYAHKVFNKWGVGKGAEDNGVLFLMALQEKKTRIEVGYGLEGDLTDAESGRIVGRNSPMADHFRSKDWSGGIDAVVDGIIAAIGGEYAPVKQRDEPRYLPIGFILLIVFLGLMIFTAIVNKIRKAGKGWIGNDPFSSGWGTGGFGGRGSSSRSDGWGGFSGGSSSGGGGGFTFGGGSSGGGGASGGW